MMTIYHVLSNHQYSDIRKILSPLGCTLQYDDMTTRAKIVKLGKVVEISNDSQFNSIRWIPGDYIFFGTGKGLFYLQKSYIPPKFAQEYLKQENQYELYEENTRYLLEVQRETRMAFLYKENNPQSLVSWKLEEEKDEKSRR